MTEMGKAVAGLAAAQAEVERVIKLSTRAIVDGGFVFHEISDPVRLRIYNEIVTEGDQSDTINKGAAP